MNRDIAGRRVCRLAFLLLVLTLPLSWLPPAWGQGEKTPPASGYSQFGGDSSRNNVVVTKRKMPTEWDWKKGKHVHWTAELGASVVTCPIVVGGRVLMGATCEDSEKSGADAACLMCFDEKSGRLVWAFESPRLSTGRVHDWPGFGMMSAPCVVKDRVWLLTNRCELVCLDLKGFADNEDDGTPSGLTANGRIDKADVVWRLDLINQLGVSPHNVSASSPTWHDGLVLINTGNGVDETHLNIPSPKAPSFLAVDGETGRVVWRDASPGENILHCQWSSPAVATIQGVTQAIFAGGDGYVYGFDFLAMKSGRTELLWWFDGNDKRSKHEIGIANGRLNILAAPVVDGDHVLIAMGRDPEHGDGDGRLWCIDASKRGDLSTEQVFNRRDPKTVIPHRRKLACDESKGDFTRINSSHGVVWKYDGVDWNGDGDHDYDERMHASVASPVVSKGLVFIADSSGIAHCLDRVTGKPWWTHDLFANVTSTPLAVGTNVYIADHDGVIHVFRQSARKSLLGKVEHAAAINGTVTSDGKAIYIPRNKLLIKVGK